MSVDADRLREAFASRQLDRLIDLRRIVLMQDYPNRRSAMAAIQ